LLHNAVLVSAVQQRESALCKHKSRLWSLPATHPRRTRLGHHRARSLTPCAVQQLPTSCLFYTLVVLPVILLYFACIAISPRSWPVLNLLSSRSVWASHCGGSSSCGVRALEHWLSNCGTRAYLPHGT